MTIEIHTQLDAFDIFSLFHENEHISFLDSCDGFGRLSEFSYIGMNSFLVLKGSKNRCFVNEDQYDIDVFDKLEELLLQYKSENDTGLPIVSGCMGYISYDYVLNEEIGNIPDYYFVFYDNIIVFDHINNRKFVNASGLLDSHKNSCDAIIRKIQAGEKAVENAFIENFTVFKSNFLKEDYLNVISKAKDYIVDGDIYIVNITQQFYAETEKSGYEIYRDLRKINPAPFSAFMKGDGVEVISSSPERFLRVTDRMVETRPIKGTRPRGENEAEDLKNRDELLWSEKDRAELLMIVDLERNDLSKVCKNHSVKVKELYRLEEYSTVFHLVATIVGELKDDVSAVECLKACFPSGSITGAPKKRAMEIISELEHKNRGIYTGCMGYFSFDGNADFSILIRTIVKEGNAVRFGVGGGITWLSDEEAEYNETLDKAKALMRVI